MPFSPHRLLPFARISVLVALTLAAAGCKIAPPRTDDPLEKANRKVYAFNSAMDKAIIRPVAVGYRKVTNPPVRRSINDFFTNIRLPITVGNDLLQARPVDALESSGRFLVNLTLGIGGFFDPASKIGIPLKQTDFGITLARWGMPEGDFLMLPLVGPSTVRDVWQLPVDGYFFDPLSRYARHHHFKAGQYYLPEVVYLVTLRARGIDAESFLQSAYDPYVFIRDAYRQQRLYEIYEGNPPNAVIERMQGLKDNNFDPEQLLDEQHQWENKHSDAPQTQPSGTSGQP